jgi:hypothetical protein
MGCKPPVGKPDMNMKKPPSEANSGRVTDPGKASVGRLTDDVLRGLIGDFRDRVFSIIRNPLGGLH